ncbi:MAG TPA: hypothetical protein VJH03_14560 [Blastocatellia bacterium]|nr:hypothetical protein [Blastocatellia bacterium]
MRDRTSKLIGAAIALGLLLNFAIALFDRLSPVQAGVAPTGVGSVLGMTPQPVILFSREGRPLATSKQIQEDGTAILLVDTETKPKSRASSERSQPQ